MQCHYVLTASKVNVILIFAYKHTPYGDLFSRVINACHSRLEKETDRIWSWVKDISSILMFTL